RLGICAVVAAAEIAAAATICAATSFLPGIGSIACAVANGAAAAATSACVSTLAFGNLASPMASAAAHAHRNGVPVVVSAGNALNPEKLPPVIRDLVNLSNRSSDAWGVVPAIFPTTISVGAVGSNLENEHFFGSSVDVWAPIRSTYFAPTNVDDPSSPLVQDDIGGTSGAAPYVAGVIASMQAANRDLDPQNPLLSDAQKRTIVERIRSLLRSNAFTNGQLVALGYPDEPTERPRLVNPLGSVQAAAGAAILGLPALGFDATLGFGELSEPDDTPAQARVLFPGVTRTGTVLTLDRTGATSPPQDQDWYTFSMPDGRPHEAFVSLITPASVDTDPVFPQGGGLTRFSSSTYRVVADASAQVDFAVTSNPGLDNVYKVTLQGVPRPALPDLRVIRPVGSSVQVCANEPITFEATASFPGFPGVVVGSRDVRWFFDGSGADPHFSAVARFAPGSHTAFVEAYGDGRTRQTISIQARLCTSGVPTGEIITPAGSSASFFWDGFDTSRGQWFYDLSVRGFASDPEDGLLTGTSLEWKTDRTDLQGELLGTGTNPTLRLYGDQCFGEDHRIRLEAEDSDSQRETLEEVVIRLSTLC
ncbi:MAG: S8 family serine peptidase, partial [Myxococcota bacterium]|nr:S8 family serine peptidase [Myxococcota bacterium]